MLAVAILAAGGSLSLTAAYGLRLRSDAYRLQIERDLSLFFHLPCEVGKIRGRTFSSRLFEDVVVYLPNRRDRVFSCETAVWQEQEHGNQPLNRLDLKDGVLILGSDRWQKSDYSKIIQSGLGHDFEEVHLSDVALERFELTFHRGDLSIRCRQTSGTIDLRNPRVGTARLNAYELNGWPINDGVRIYARFSPQNGVDVSELSLSLPEVPLSTIGLGPELGSRITQGRFSGHIQYLKGDASDKPEIWIRGDLVDAALSELTQTIPLGPFQGAFSVNVYGARLCDSIVTHFRGRGRITDVSLTPFGHLMDQPHLSGTASFNIDLVDIALGHIHRLRLEGRIHDMALPELLQKWAQGSATGTLEMRVNNLDVVEDHIKSADIEITATPPKGSPGTIDRSLLLKLAEEVLDFSWPASIPKRILPQHLEYTQFGIRLLIRDDKMRILGTHGRHDDTILTVVLFNRSFGLIKEQAGTIDLAHYLKTISQWIRTADPRRVRKWWKSKSG